MKVKNRVKSHQDFEKIINFGESNRNEIFKIYYMNNNLNYTRIGISVPKKSGNAVVRNKIKRQIRAIIANGVDLTKSVDIILVVRKDYHLDEFTKTNNLLLELIEKVG